MENKTRNGHELIEYRIKQIEAKLDSGFDKVFSKLDVIQSEQASIRIILSQHEQADIDLEKKTINSPQELKQSQPGWENCKMLSLA